MTSHELAQKLLKFPNVKVAVPHKQDSFELVTKIELVEFEKEILQDGDLSKLIYLSGDNFNQKSK